jgi:hypothetical protein
MMDRLNRLQSHSLLVQFVLTEFIGAYPQVISAERLFGQLEKELGDGQFEHQLPQLARTMSSLTDGLVEEDQPFPWMASRGKLSKLKYYCQVYEHPDVAVSSTIADLKAASSKAFHAVLQARELIGQLSNPVEEGRCRTDLAHFSQLLGRCSAKMNELSELLAILLPLYQRDENVLYFLLRHQLEFNGLYHPLFLRQQLLAMFENSLSKAEEFLVGRYQTRGFDHIVPNISRYLNQMDAPCAPESL